MLKPLRSNTVKYMSRFIFAALGSLVVASAAAAQVPGRDLLEFPLGLLAESAPLSSQMTGGFWNPAAGALRSSHASVGFAGLTSPQNQGVSLDLLAGAYRIKPRITALVSAATASVSDILRTETDPQSLGGEIPYNTSLYSAGVATVMKDASVGLMLRYRRGTSDAEHRGSFVADGGFVLERVANTPIRLAASTFLFTPTAKNRDASYTAAADFPVVRRDSTIIVRLGHAIGQTEGSGREQYSFTTATVRSVDLSAGLSRSVAFGNTNTRWRLGCALHYVGYTVAVGREDGAAGFGASYQFLLKRVVR